MERLLLILPYLSEEIGLVQYRKQVQELTEKLSKHKISVDMQDAEYDARGTRITAGDSQLVVLTDDAGFAFFCMGSEIPYCILLDEASRNASLPNGAFCIERLEDVEPDYLEKIYRRAKELPWDILETERLKLREITLRDVPRLYELYQDESITRYMEPLYEDIKQELSYTQDYINHIYGFYGYGMWVITLKNTGEVIGRAGLEYKEEAEGLELGFMLGVKYQHQGYAYEACRAVLDYGQYQLGQESFCAQVNEQNIPSRRLCEQLGMKTDGILNEQGLLTYRK